MWRLVDVASGKCIEAFAYDTWKLCKNSYHADGSKIKKAEAREFEEGTIIYRYLKTKRFMKIPVVEDGNVVNESTRTTDVNYLHPFRLEKH